MSGIKDLSARITSITVQAQNKSWGSDGKEQGRSGETIITWVLEHPVQGGSWSSEEAQITTILARKELQRILIADAMARGVPSPDVGVSSLPGYDKAIGILKGEISPMENTNSIE